jgi:hypothetical protein
LVLLRLQVEMARWMGPDAIRATMFGQMRDAMKDDVEKLLQVQGDHSRQMQQPRVTTARHSKQLLMRPDSTTEQPAGSCPFYHHQL